MNEQEDLEFLDRIENDPESLAELTHQTMMEKYGVEGIELIMWLVMRGALSRDAQAGTPQLLRAHDHRHGPHHARRTSLASIHNRGRACPAQETLNDDVHPERLVRRGVVE